MLKSLPSRERGLKSFAWESNKLVNTSLPSRERGLKFMNHIFIKIEKTVAPLAGAWIEIIDMRHGSSIWHCRSPRGSVD